ncbi:MAG TPA: 5'/3'-nucleotidase SurE [bacterium]|nr:5'/3'-nucleotidase SurE [bacterium]
MSRTRPLILVSNDDGFRADGILALTESLQRVGRVVVVAPDDEQSASSHSLTLHRPLRVHRQGEGVFSVNGTPTDCITLAVHTILGRRPDLIVSGINRGANLCDDVHYSGTVSAAVEGALMGIPSIAVSLVAYGEDFPYYATASGFAARLSRRVMKERLPLGFVLNVNVPNLPESKVRGHEFTRLGKRDFGDVIVEKIDPRGRKYYWIAGNERRFRNVPGSDGNALKARKVAITPLQVDLTHYPLLESMRGWKL